MNNEVFDSWYELVCFLLIIVLLALTILLASCSLFQKPIDNTPQFNPNLTPETIKLLTKTNLLCATGIIIMGIGAFGAAKLKDWGFPAIVGGVTVVVTSLATAQYAKWIASIGFIFMIATMTVTFILKLKKAIKQLVKGIQKIRNIAKTSSVLKDNNGVDLNTTITSNIASEQDEDTQKIVQETKAELKVKGEI